jgi:hypothetical protein
MSRSFSLLVDAPESIVVSRLDRAAAEELVVKRGAPGFGPWLGHPTGKQSKDTFRVERAKAGFLSRGNTVVLKFTLAAEAGQTRVTGRFHSKVPPLGVALVAGFVPSLSAFYAPGLIGGARDLARPLVDWGTLNPRTNADAVVVIVSFMALIGFGYRGLQKLEEAWLRRAITRLLERGDLPGS